MAFATLQVEAARLTSCEVEARIILYGLQHLRTYHTYSMYVRTCVRTYVLTVKLKNRDSTGTSGKTTVLSGFLDNFEINNTAYCTHKNV